MSQEVQPRAAQLRHQEIVSVSVPTLANSFRTWLWGFRVFALLLVAMGRG
jgi:hypothetical protein